ncbi:sushi, von Willebrand factor type A, EGF and pentraxin domain-containing protein 1 [Lingula anatina]|uniref:Sushi, von Willebrand factor type A, EGF and pentraxin domain-containing protein 1 n=1 Tax=Lingula anatina TaxID=7574 RepID=A0A1S3KGB1_LINAN|nr:sushi, von Willebrand factor type A, EGF and pentraxin domain-containing protein 1 [Lingula anatina]|eukprot:XP_013421527.1 sushi, von Willebrand factor type A, EGF and pentraxin domain-containing protein 1 [Lingula anatina]
MTLTAFLYSVDIHRQTVAAESGASYCPTFESTYGMCISPTDTTADYETAKASCENLCSTLMFIKESSNHFTLMFYLAANGVTDSLWLGLSYNDSRGSTSDFSEFRWSDGEYVNFTVTDGNPGDVVGTCQGVALTPSGFGSWTRQGCETLSRYVCQRTLGNPPDTVCSHPTAISGGYSTPTYGLCSTGTNCCSVNTTVVFNCDPGYYVSGPTSVYCASSGLLSTTVTSTCLPLPCPSISIPVENHVTVTSTSGSMTDTVTYICQNGYEMADSSTTLSNLCTWNYTQEAMAWTVEPPVCYGLPCPDLTIDHAGNYNCTGINGTMGDMVTCTCYPGYAYGSGSNTLVLTCTWVVSSTGWSTSLTSCAAQPCPPLINLITADHHVQIPDSSTVTVGQSAFVFCEGGYALNGETTQNITCSASGATSADWVGSLTPCVALPCPAIELTPENHLVMANLSGSMGDRITFECETNYTLPGFVNTMVADCIWDGLSTAWSQPVPSCIAICASPTIPAENHVTGNVSVAIVGDRILYVCESGYAVQSGDLYLTSVSVGCVSDVHVGAVWETNPPVCIGLPCPPVIVTEWTHAQVTGNLTASRVGDKVDVACKPGYSVDDSVTTNYSIACIINDAQSGQWGQPLANCTPTPCPSVLAMSANGVEFNNSAAAFGDVVNFTCTPGYVHEDPAVTSVVVGCVLQNGSSTPLWEVDPPPCYGLPCPNMTFPNDVRQAGTSNVTSNVTSGPQWIADGRVGDTYTFHCVENIVFPDGSSEFTVACVWQGNETGWNREVPSCRETNLLDSLNISALTSPSAIADALNGTLGSMSADSSNGTTNTEQLKELRDVLMNSLSSVLDTVSDEAGLVSVANLMSTVTDTTPDQLSDNAMDQAANMSTALLGHVASANLSTTAVTSLLTCVTR